jgi:hypothetical protein
MVRPSRMPAMPNSLEKVRITITSLRLAASFAAFGASAQWM